MTKTLIIQMDEPSGFNPKTDSTLELALEAQRRDYAVYYYTPPQLTCRNGEIVAQVTPITFRDQREDFYTTGEPREMALEEADVILIRQNPPYNMEYLSGLWLLDRLSHPKVLNNPASILKRPEKIFPLEFPHYVPPTCISADVAQLKAFQQQQGECVLKPLYGYAGQSVFHISADGRNLQALLETLLSHSGEPLILQEFLPDVATKDCRLLLIEGELVATMGRIPAKGEIRANGVHGAVFKATTPTARQEEIARVIGKTCRDEGLLLVGIDVIGDTLIEINTTCPTGMRVGREFLGVNLAGLFWDAAEAS